MSTFSLQSPPGQGQPVPRFTSTVVRPVQVRPGQAPVPVPGYFIRAPLPGQVPPGGPRPVPAPGVHPQSPVAVTRPTRWTVVPGAAPHPAGAKSVPVRPQPVPIAPKQPMQAPPPTTATPIVNAAQPTPVAQPTQPVHPMQVLGQNLLATPAPEQTEPDTSEETRHESEASSATATSPVEVASPIEGETVTPPPDSPESPATEPDQPEDASATKGQTVSALLEQLSGKSPPADADVTVAASDNGNSGSKTKEARQREQPALAALADAFADGKDDNHLQRGLEPTVRKLELPEAGLYPDMEDMGQAEWPTWMDSVSDTGRGGAIAFLPASVQSDTHCIYFVHGGGFEYGAPLEDGYDSLCSRIAAGSGLPVVCPDHPLSGESRPFKAPEIIDVLLKGFRWLLRFDPVTKERRTTAPKVIIAGDSAGAAQALSIVLRALSLDDQELVASICGLILISPWLDLSCGSHTYVSNAYAKEGHTGDIAFREHADDNRASFRGMGLTYTGSAALLKDPVFSPYWLARSGPELVAKLAQAQTPIWICAGAAETLVGEVLDFAERLRSKVPIEGWLHEGMFHDWVMYTADHPLPSKDVAMKNMYDFIARIRNPPFVAAPGIHYYIDEWK